MLSPNHQSLSYTPGPELEQATFHTLSMIDGDLGRELADYHGFPSVQSDILKDYLDYFALQQELKSLHVGILSTTSETLLVLN